MRFFMLSHALKNNPKLNAERENLKAIKENENISISEFLPSLTISGSQTSTETSNIVDQSGSPSGNTKRNTETKENFSRSKNFSRISRLQ